MPPTRQFARIVVAILARAQELYPVRIHSAVMASNHYHLILTPENREQLADFMEYVNGNVAREAFRLVGWGQGPPGGRCQRIQPVNLGFYPPLP